MQKGAKLAHLWGQKDKMQVRPCQKLSKERRVETALLLGAKKVTGGWVNFYHAQPMGSTFRRDIRVLHGHPRRWPTLRSPLRNPSSQHWVMSQPLPHRSTQHVLQPHHPASTHARAGWPSPVCHGMTIITRQRRLEAATSPPCVTRNFTQWVRRKHGSLPFA